MTAAIAERSTGLEMAAPPKAKVRERIAGFELARVIACLGVVWLHVGHTEYAMLGQFRMPFFAALSAYLTAQSFVRGRGTGLAKFIGHRAHRVLVPFAAWSVIYAVLTYLIDGTPPSFTAGLVFRGTSFHLWFLPFIFCVSPALYYLSAWIARQPRDRLIRICVGLIAIGIVYSFLHPYPNPGRYAALPLWTARFGALLIGVALAFLESSPRIQSVILRMWYIWWALWMGGVIATVWLDLDDSNGLAVLNGVTLLLAGRSTPLFGLERAAFWAGKQAYGIILAHAAFIMLLAKSASLDGNRWALVRYGIVVAGALAVSVVVQWRPLRTVLLGIPRRANGVKNNVNPRQAGMNGTGGMAETARVTERAGGVRRG